MRLFTTGFELGEVIEHNGNISEYLSGYEVQTGIVRTGAYALKLALGGVIYPGPSYWPYFWFSQVLDAYRTELYARVAIRIGTSYGADTTRQMFLAFLDQSTIQCGVGIRTSDQRLVFAVGGTNEMGQEGGTEYVGQKVITAGTWYVVEVYVKFDSGSAGQVVVKVNGITDISQSGIATAVTANGCDIVRFGGSAAGSGNGFDIYLDDIGLNDTAGTYETGWLGQGGVYLLVPNSDVVTEWQTSDGGTVHWALVDEVPKGTTDWVYEKTVGLRDIFGFTDLPSEVTSVNLVQVVYQAALAKAGAATLRDVLRVGTVDYEGIAETLTNVVPNYVVVHGTAHYVNPASTAAWTPADVNAVAGGMKIV